MKRIFTSVLIGAACIATGSAQHGHDHQQPETGSLIEHLDLELGVVIDANFYHENSKEGLSHVKEEMPGFSHGHPEDEHGHGQENGFNLKEVEVYLSGEIGEYLRAETTLAFTSDDAELETAYVKTTSLPGGLALKGGKFFSDFGILNAQHPHQWDFSDQPLIYELTLGDHGLNDIGVQASWSFADPVFLTLGVEALQGDNENLFFAADADSLPEHSGPRLGVGWLKIGPDLGHDRVLTFGASVGSGWHQEIHEEQVGTNNYLDGMSWFFGADMLYQYAAHGDRGQGDFTLQAEYFYRNKTLDLEASDDPATTLGDNLDSTQDGYYVQALYGFLPRWRSGFRWEQVGLTNKESEPGEPAETFDDSWRASAMLDFSPTPKSVIRLQVSNGDYATEDGIENVWETYLQLVVTLGAHRHKGGQVCSGQH